MSTRNDVVLKNTFTVCFNYMKRMAERKEKHPDCQPVFVTQLRDMSDDKVRNQPQCPKCRSRHGRDE